MIVIRPATKDDAAHVGAHLRSEDEREVQTSTGQSGTQLVPLSFSISRECYAVFPCPFGEPEDKPCAVFGVADDPNQDRGIVWLLATEDIRRCALSVIRESRFWLDHMSRHYPLGLFNTADQRNALHIRWARLSGFQVGGSELKNGHRFIHINYPYHRV